MPVRDEEKSLVFEREARPFYLEAKAEVRSLWSVTVHVDYPLLADSNFSE
jgi:hypothetical protein